MRRPRLSPLSARAVSGPLTLLLAAVVLAAAGGLLVWNGNPPVHAQVISAPARPSGLAATAGLERVTLSWEDPGDDTITGYEYYQAAELAKLTATDGAGGDSFGHPVSVDGDTMVVGANWDDGGSGSAYVFVRPAGEDWSEATQVAKLKATDGAGGDQFGISVSVEGDTVVVGAYVDDDDGSDSGSAYVFVRPSDGEWATATETAKLTASDGAEGDNFGYSVSVDGETVVVGANRDDNLTGSAYVFVKPSTGWASTIETAKLTASDGAGGDQLGISVSVDGDTVAAGASEDFSRNLTGSAYVFVGPSTGWANATETAKLTPSDGANFDDFGASVSVEGDTVVVGADEDDDNGSNSGSAYVFVRPSTGWANATEAAKLTASDGAEGDVFGTSVSVEGDTVVVGANEDDDNGSNSGSAYVFVRPATGWANATEAAKLTASDGAEGDVFGTSVSVEGDTVVVGAYADDDNGAAAGSAYAFAASGWMQIGGSGAGTVEHTVEELDGWIEHTFGIRALNGGGLGPASRSVTATPFANRAPEFATATTTRTVAENTAAGENIGGPVTAADLDSGDTLVYSLSGVDAASLDIDTATGQITVGSETSLDYETKASYTVTVSVHDGRDSGENADTTEDDSVEVTINVTDEEEQPGLSGSSAVSYAENGTAPVASYTAADPEGATVNWSLSGDDSGDFSISAVGALRFNASPNFENAQDADTTNTYLVTVEATDGTTDKVTLAVTVTVTNEEEAGSVILSPTQPVVGTALTATLADPDGSISAATWVWAGSTDGLTGWTDISGATSGSYIPTAADVGSYLGRP